MIKCRELECTRRLIVRFENTTLLNKSTGPFIGVPLKPAPKLPQSAANLINGQRSQVVTLQW